MKKARTLLETPVFTVRERRASSPQTGRQGCFFYLNAPAWVNVIAVTPSHEVVMIEQFRHGTGEVTLEIPGGMIDSGETPLAAAVRELDEETGYGGRRARLIGVVAPNPAIQNNHCHTALIEEARLKGEQHLDPHEEIGVRLVELDRIPDLIRQGIIQHALVICAFHHLSLLKKYCPAQAALRVSR